MVTLIKANHVYDVMKTLADGGIGRHIRSQSPDNRQRRAGADVPRPAAAAGPTDDAGTVIRILARPG